jgi:hypothetical protein
VAWQPVEACFRRTGRILHLHFPDGELIRTTPEHPFFVEGQGWTAAGALKAGDRVVTLIGDSVPVSEVYDTGEWEFVYNLRVAEYHTYFVGDEHWGFAAWAHNIECAEVDRIIRTVFTDEGLTPQGMNARQGGTKVGNRAEWASRVYLAQHLAAKINQLYTGRYQAADVQRVAELAADKMLKAARGKDIDPQTATFKAPDLNPRDAQFVPQSATVPVEVMSYAHRQYTMSYTRLGQTYTVNPIVLNLNDGAWDVSLTAQLQSGGLAKDAKGLYILRNPTTGLIYKVGKADSGGLVGRLEWYAKYWVSRGVAVKAEAYPLPASGWGLRDAEMVLRDQLIGDHWTLASDGSADEIKPQGTGGWNAEILN